MVTDPTYWLGQHETSIFPLKVLPEAAFWWSAPCWLEERAARHPQPCLHLEVSGSGKGGGEDNSGSCAIKVDLDSLRKFSVLLPEENRPISGGLGKNLVDTPLGDCGSLVIVSVSANTLHNTP